MTEGTFGTADAPPPVGNTGVEMTGVGLGWLQGTTKKADQVHVLSVLSAASGAEPEPRPGGTRWYAESATVGLHALVAWSPRSRPNIAETYVEVRQSGLDELGGQRLWPSRRSSSRRECGSPERMATTTTGRGARSRRPSPMRSAGATF